MADPDILPAGLFSFFAPSPANTAAGLTYPAMEARRKIALQIMANSGKKGFPKNVGEGLTAIGDAIGERGQMNQLMQMEAAYGRQAAATSQDSIPPEFRTPAAPQRTSEGPTDGPAVAAYASDDTQPQPQSEPAAAATGSTGYRPAPAYLQASLDRLIQDQERRGYLGQLAGKEAQSANEVSPTGAAGPFQFIRSTGQQYGLVGNGQDRRTDIDASILAANQLTDDNVKTLTARLGRAPTPGEMALAHQQGAVTAANMISGTGNAPARNLAVNNVAPGTDPGAAASKIMNYYAMPARDRLANAVTQQATARAVPPLNPTLPGSALPLSATAPAPGGPAADLPPEITQGFSARPPASTIQSAPPVQQPIRTAPQPVQVAQAVPRVALPPQEPPTEAEKLGWAQKAKANALQDPYMLKQADDLIAYGAQQRKQRQDLIDKDWQDQMLARRAEEAARAAFERSGPQRELEMAKARQGLIQQPTVVTPPANAQMAGPGVPSDVDPRLGTPQSPQRTGVPAAPPIPPGITPEQHASQQAPILTKAVEAEQKATPEFRQSLDLIRGLRDHPGREWGLGAGSKIAGQIPGTEAYAFQQRLNQLQGKQFLQAYQTLKGGGSITEIEGAKATQAMARINAAQNPKEFDIALNELEKTMRSDLEQAQRKVNRPVTAWQGSPNDAYAPDIGQRRGNKEYIGGSPSDPASWRTVQ